MRKLEEICKDIEVIDNQMNILKERKEMLHNEKRERLFADFCDKYGIKGGDIVEFNDKKHTQLQVVGMSRRWSGRILCRKIKKNGEFYVSTATYTPWHFDGCKVVKTKDD